MQTNRRRTTQTSRHTGFFSKPIRPLYVNSFYTMSTLASIGMLIFVGIKNMRALEYVQHSDCFQHQQPDTIEACHYNIAGKLTYISSAFCKPDNHDFDCEKFINYVRPSEIAVITLMTYISFVMAIITIHICRKVYFENKEKDSEQTPILSMA